VPSASGRISAYTCCHQHRRRYLDLSTDGPTPRLLRGLLAGRASHPPIAATSTLTVTTRLRNSGHKFASKDDATTHKGCHQVRRLCSHESGTMSSPEAICE
jgi:hypothetical protein